MIDNQPPPALLSVVAEIDPHGNFSAQIARRLDQATHYSVSENLDGGRSITYTLVIPPASAEETELANALVERDGGPTVADLEYRDQLSRMVGSVALAGGQVEFALKRVLVALSPNHENFEDADLEWAALEGQVRRLADAGKSIDAGAADAAVQLLERAAKKHLRERRNAVIHSAFWLFAEESPEHVRMSRFPRKKPGAVLLGSMKELQQTYVGLEKLADDLNKLIETRWGKIILPRETLKNSAFFHASE